VFDKFVQLAVFGVGYRLIAGPGCSATTLRRRRDEWIEARAPAKSRGDTLTCTDAVVLAFCR